MPLAYIVMEPEIRIVYCWMVIGLFLSMSIKPSNSTFMYPHVEESSTQSQSMFSNYDYARYPEVRRECNSILPSTLELEYDRNRVHLIKNELSFYYGDWESNGNKPLVPMPFVNATADAFHLASFSVLNVKQDREDDSLIVKVSGSMSVWITGANRYNELSRAIPLDTSFSFPADNTSQFDFMPGFSSLNILFEGIYTESEVNGEERILCLLGKTSIPSRKRNSLHPQEPQNAWRTSTNQFSLLEDDKILIVLHYPKSLSLTSRGIDGEMMSRHGQTDSLYFDKINLSSQLGPYSNYQFVSEKLVLRTCNPYPYQDKLLSDQITICKALRVCELLNHFASGPFFIVPNWKCDSSGEYCNKLGPFKPSKKAGETDGVFGNIKLFMQDVRCEAEPAHGNASSVRVSAVFRAMSSIEEQIVGQRTSLDGMTLAAEGTWNSNSGQLCMVGCLGASDKNCDSRVLLYFSLSFSISQRNVLVGSISNSDANGAVSYYPLSFGRRVSPWELQAFDYLSALVSYKYTKITTASAFLERNEAFDANTLIKKSLLRYPKVEDSYSEAFSLSNLAEDLSFDTRIVPNLITDTRIRMEIFTVGSLLGRSWFMNSTRPERQMPTKPVSTERDLFLNVSAMLTLFNNNRKSFSNISELFLEGLYNPIDGKMYLIGCRDAHAPWKVLLESFDLENGLDCLIEVKIEYPPVTVRWLVSQTVKVSISSKRNDDDPLHFGSVKLQTFPIIYRRQREDMLAQRNVEGILQILTLSLTIACIFSQLTFIRKDTSSVPYISIVMLSVLTLGYVIPLISGAEALFFGRKSKSHGNSFVDLQNDQSSHLIDYFLKILFLVAFLLTLRLVQKVWKSRIRLSSHVPSEPKQVPNDKWVFFTCLCIHIVGFLVVVSVNAFSKQNNAMGEYVDPSGRFYKSRQWGVELEEYVGMVQDFFLLPQVIGNFLWQLDGKPLRKTYFIGITVIRTLPHVYDYMRLPTFNPYASEEFEFVNPNMDFYSKFGDIAIPIIASLLAFVTYCQQRWNFQKQCQSLGLERVKIASLRSQVYERLPTISREAELVGVDEDANQRQQREGEQ